MNKNIRRILSAVLSLAMTLSLAACGEKNSSAQPGSTGADGEKNTELNVALAGEPNALDPMCGATDRTSSAVYNNIYDTLLVADEKGNILPNLAEYELINDTTYEFKVIKGIKWHNGDELKANDIAFTMKKGCETAITKYIWGAIDPDRIEIIDEYTLRVSTFEPAPALLALMTALPVSSALALCPPLNTPEGVNPGNPPFSFRYPGSPERCTANTPATVPARLLLIERVVETFNLAGSIVVIEPTTDSFFCAP